ncbi:hypothetical protein P154DRAFT_604701 [Amniculicola lignicola CBS 123094]|uniref:FAD-binding domain-containing protein n=1 Tax=Amniculicola lignicola CBS 123094 TaxID=1392246 RepID=A0A6A5WA88_9PLEO|nr:hypothetical protein P154DRAFT_604701 [Amniculicola lignicola CBS 123094]
MAPNSPKPFRIITLRGGIIIYEIKPVPVTIDGAVNLKPDALRLLSLLGALQELQEKRYGEKCLAVEVFDLYTETKMAESSFCGPEGNGLVGIKGNENSVELAIENGGNHTADIFVGWDGIHSVTRCKHRHDISKANAEYEPVHFETSGMNFSRRGILLKSFHDKSKESIYVGALMQVAEIGSNNGWKAAGAYLPKTRTQITDRLSEDAALLLIRYWSTERVMLVDNAAHAMSLQGESTSIVFKATVLFARCIGRGSSFLGKELMELYDENQSVVKTVLDAGWLGHNIKMRIMSWFLWQTSSVRGEHFVGDFTSSDVGY